MGKYLPGIAAGGSVGGLLGGIFGNQDFENPADAAMPYLNELMQKLPQYFSPYINQGQSMYPSLNNQYGRMVNDPTSVQDEIGSHFKASPGYQYQVGEATNAANSAAAAGGMLGSPKEQQELAGKVQGMASQDYNNYENRGMGTYERGLQGQQGIYNTGAQMSASLAQMIEQALASQAQNAYAGAANKNQNQSGTDSGIGAILGGIAGGLML